MISSGKPNGFFHRTFQKIALNNVKKMVNFYGIEGTEQRINELPKDRQKEKEVLMKAYSNLFTPKD